MRRPEVPDHLRIARAELAGAVSRLALSGLPLEEQLAEVRGITRDPHVLGDVLGCQLGAEHPTASTAAAIELLRAAGADEDMAAAVAEWQRWRVATRGQGPGLGR